MLDPLNRKIKSAKGQAALHAAQEKLAEKGRERYVVPTALAAVSRQLQVRPYDWRSCPRQARGSRRCELLDLQ